MRLTIVLLVFTIISASCKKEDPSQPECEPVVAQNYSNDTIFPSDYIMAYPGSWWEYDNGIIDSCTSWKTVPFRSTNLYNGCLLVNEDQWIIPEGLIYESNIGFNQSIRNAGDYNATRCTPIFDTLVGVFHDVTFSGGSGTGSYTEHDTGETLERLDSIIIGSNTYYDVLHVKLVRDIDYAHWSGSGPHYVSELWLAKNVGLVKYIDNENFFDMELVDHYIAPY